MTPDQCKALGLVPYAVYGGKVESFKVREYAPETYGDPVLLKVLDDLLADHQAKIGLLQAAERNLDAAFEDRDKWQRVALDCGAKADALKIELDALKKQIAAGEPFDSDEIEAMQESQCKTCKWRNGPCIHDEERDLGNPIQECTLYEREQPRFDNDGPWVDALSDAVAKARMVQPEEAVGKLTVGFEQVVGRGQRKTCGTCGKFGVICDRARADNLPPNNCWTSKKYGSMF